LSHLLSRSFRLCGCIGLWLLCFPVYAQEASISGHILRRGVVPMARAHISYTSEGGASYEALTDSAGFYSMSAIGLSVSERNSQPPRPAAAIAGSVGSSCSIYFSASKPLPTARIYDLLGREVAVLDLSAAQSNGMWISTGYWNGMTASGVPAANGVYFATGAGDGGLLARKFIHLRDGSAGSPPRVTAPVLNALVLDNNRTQSLRRPTTLDDAFTVTITPDSQGPRFAPRTLSRELHGGDNGVVEDTVWSAVPRSILFVGNSYTYVNGGVDVHLADLVHTAHPESGLTTANVTVGGYTLGDHYVYGPTRAAIDTGGWDVVVLQEQSERPALEPDSFYYYTRLMNDAVLHVRSETAFYMTWARQYDPPMIEPLAAAYDSMGHELGAVVSPCGRAFQRVCEDDTTINLYDSDGSHPSVWGTYLVCCVFYAALVQESPIGISYVNDPLITDEQRTYLQTVAWETVSNRLP
jgi:hypothetical protein